MWREPLKWNKSAKEAGERRRVFCASLADVFEGRDTMPHGSAHTVEAARLRLFGLILATPNLDWLLLTKRPQKVKDAIAQAARDCYTTEDDNPLCDMLTDWLAGKPPRNIWLGTSVEDQQRADERIPLLLQIPATVRFLSCEPLLGPVDFSKSVPCGECGLLDSERGYGCFNGNECVDVGWFGKAGLHWVIVGGESGHGSRPFNLAWARDIRDQCRAAGVAYFMKQLGSDPVSEDDGDASNSKHSGTRYALGTLLLKDRKGGDLSEIPSDLQIRDFPATQGGNP